MPIAPLLPGQHLNADDTSPGGGRFMIEKPLSAGGFAITYLAYDQQTGDRCVIKELAIDQLMVRSGADMVPLPGRDGDVAIWVQKVEKEANTLHRLRNAGVVPIRTTWRENGTAYFAMDFIDGIELPAEPTAGAGWATWEPVALKFLTALGAIHAEGLVHGDIKPANILVDRAGNPVIIDFGTARSTEEAKKTRLTTVAMTPGYCPPELAVRDRAREMGPWSDLYSWSLSVMGLVIRHRGIDGAPLDTSARVALAQHGLAEAGMGAETASALREAAVPEPWIAVLMACVALEPSARPQSAAAVIASLQPAPVARSLPPVPQKVAAPEPAPVAAAPAPAPAPAPAAATTSTAEDAASRAAAAAARYDSLSPQPKPAGSRKALVTVLAFGAVAAVGIALAVGMRGAPPPPGYDGEFAYGSAEPTPEQAAVPAAEPAAEPEVIPPPAPIEPAPAVPEPVPEPSSEAPVMVQRGSNCVIMWRGQDLITDDRCYEESVVTVRRINDFNGKSLPFRHDNTLFYVFDISTYGTGNACDGNDYYVVGVGAEYAWVTNRFGGCAHPLSLSGTDDGIKLKLDTPEGVVSCRVTPGSAACSQPVPPPKPPVVSSRRIRVGGTLHEGYRSNDGIPSIESSSGDQRFDITEARNCPLGEHFGGWVELDLSCETLANGYESCACDALRLPD
ncbi:MAG: serine/threonine protein kinase [Deltaproteobacteria bacterium]|nr:serine/threonine protein kinase [Deltaproteobacteria bacterium]